MGYGVTLERHGVIAECLVDLCRVLGEVGAQPQLDRLAQSVDSPGGDG